MVARAKGYYGAPFKVFREVTQGGQLSPNILNLIIDTVLRNWVIIVESMEEAVDPGTAGTEGFRRDMQRFAGYFYADDELLASTRATRLQWEFDTLMELFDHVGLSTNVNKTEEWIYSHAVRLGATLQRPKEYV